MKRILIVDDKDENLRYLQAVLTGPDVMTETACHGAEALVKARQNVPDVVISDLLMPVMDGFTLLRLWKTDPTLHRVPFIVYTATYTTPEDEQVALSLGAAAFLLKSTKPEHLVARLQEVQTNAASANPTPPPRVMAEGEGVQLKLYNEMLIRKLEEKTQQLAAANLALERDVVERVRTLERLTEAQRIGKIGDWEWDLATQTISWSPEVFAIVGRDPRLGPPRDYEEQTALFDEPSREFLQEKVAHAISSGEAQNYELVVLRPGGERVAVHAMALPKKAEGGRITGLYGTIQDITERKRIETRMRRLVESDVQGVLFWNTNGAVTKANDAFLATTGYTREDLDAGRLNWWKMTPPEYAEMDRRALAELAFRGACTQYEKECFRKDGTRVPIVVGAATFEDNPEEGVCFVLDLTERRKLERQFLRSQRMESLGTLAGGIAHDLNNALAPILMSIALLKEEMSETERLESLSTIEICAQRGADMVSQLLSFARGVEGRRLEVEVRHLLHDVAKIVTDTFPKHIRISTEIPPDLWTISADPTQLHQVLINLCVNARDAMPDGGQLVLSAKNEMLDKHYAALLGEAQAGVHVVLQVQDSGVGIPPEIIEKIFDPFFTTKEVGKGTGLGLSTSLAIIKSHGGFIRAYSEPNRGTRFQIYLPAASPTADDIRVDRPTVPCGNGELVLVVDDEAPVRQITRLTLEAFGYRVLVAQDGVEAIALYADRRDDIAVVLTDIMMPVMDGLATIQVLLKMNPKVRIIAASGLNTEDRASKAVKAGVKHFLAKPYTAETMLNTLQAVLHPPRAN